MLLLVKQDSVIEFHFTLKSLETTFPTFSILLDDSHFKTLWTWFCVINENNSIREGLHQLWWELIGISFVHLSGLAAMKKKIKSINK